MDTIQIIGILSLLLLAFWRGKEREGVLLYALVGGAMIALGLTWTESYTAARDYVISVASIGLGVYCLVIATFNIIVRIRSR